MKNKLKNLVLKGVLIILVTFGVSSCTNKNPEPASNYHYYSFNDADKKWLLEGLKKDDLVTYVNSKNEKFVFKVAYSEIILREAYEIGGGWKTDGAKRFEYDVKDIQLNCISTPYAGIIEMTIRKFPLDVSPYEVSPYNIQTPYEFPGQLTVQLKVPKWNYVDYTGYPRLTDAIIKDDICCSTPMVINNKTYNQVFTILSGNNQPYTPCTTGCWTYDVNKMLYDKQKGVVGWENIAGEKWMLE